MGGLGMHSRLPVLWVGTDLLHGATLARVPGKDMGLVATQALVPGHLVIAAQIPSPGVVCHSAVQLSSPDQPAISRGVRDWYGFGSNDDEIAPEIGTDRSTGLVTLKASPLFACNEPRMEDTINCKVVVCAHKDNPVSIKLYTTVSVNKGEELTIFYGRDRHDQSYARDECRWAHDDLKGYEQLCSMGCC